MRTAAIRRVAAVAAVLLVGGGLGVAAVPAGGGEIVVFDATVDPNPSEAGDDVTVRPETAEDNCPVAVLESDAVDTAGGSGVQLEWELIEEPFMVVDSGVETVGIDGSWEVVLTAPEPGTYWFAASCMELAPENLGVGAAGVTPLARYDEVLIVSGFVSPGFSASLDQSSGPAGDDIEVTALECAGGTGAAALLPGTVIDYITPDDIDEALLQQYDVLEGGFQGVVPVPADATPGTYQVVVFCMQGSDVLNTLVLPYTVTGAAVPVPGDPTFTG